MCRFCIGNTLIMSQSEEAQGFRARVQVGHNARQWRGNVHTQALHANANQTAQVDQADIKWDNSR